MTSCWARSNLLLLFLVPALVNGAFISNSGRWRIGGHSRLVVVPWKKSTKSSPLHCPPTRRFFVDPGEDSEIGDQVKEETEPGSEEVANTTASVNNNQQSEDVASTPIEGIGGKGGLVYDVNRLKRNLLQETMTAYKEELWDLLAEGDDADIVEKLQALVQASPVRTTTDSNLLDSQDHWILAYRSQFPTTVASLVLYDEGDSSNNYNPRYAFLWNDISPQESDSSRSMKTTKHFLQRNVVFNKFKEFFQTKQRTFGLEDLKEDEDAYVMDTTLILGGLITKTKRYSLDGLTRSSLSLKKLFSLWSLMGRASSKRIENALSHQQQQQGNKESQKTVQIVYLDNDLCILTEADGPDSPFMVYTRNKAYVNTYTSMKRKVRVLKAAVLGLVTWPARRLAQRNNEVVGYPSSSLKRRSKFGTTAPPDDTILTEILQDHHKPKQANNNNAVKLRVLRLGDVNESEEDESWESETDPFVHLSADERQKKLKEMSVEEVERAADEYRNSRLRFRWLRRLFGRRKTNFKKPPENYRRPKK